MERPEVDDSEGAEGAGDAGRRVREGGGFPVTLRHHAYLRTGPAGGAGTPLGGDYPVDPLPNLEMRRISVKIP